MRWRMTLVLGAMPLSGVAHAQQPQQSGIADSARVSSAVKRVLAVALERTGAGVRVDGRLDEMAWQRAQWISSFTQREPVEGAPSSQRTEVAFVYDDDALYVGARLHSDDADGVRALVTRRDQESSSEQLIVSLDTYRDRRTAYSFGITAAGVRLDYIHPSDRESQRDYSFDPVWEGKTAIDADGWTAELRIPFRQLRFNRCATKRSQAVPLTSDNSASESTDRLPSAASGAACTWGVNLTRRIPARNEDDYLILVRRNETGWASRFAELVGVEADRPSRRVELTPYATSEAKLLSDADLSNPFVQRHELTNRFGADLKLGLGSNLTLNATVNPDFAQVEADPAEVNLTAFETVFPEHRPFFVEGSQLLKAGGLTWFHSRRIGQAPRLKASGDYAEKLTSTTIAGAAKITGRLRSGLSVGILSAVTGPGVARTYVTRSDTYGKATIEPRTGFGVVRLQQELGSSGSTAGIIFTSVDRAVSNDPALRALLPRQAYAGALDWNLRFLNRTYALSGAAGLSRVAGDSSAMLRIQRSSAHYFQRPDGRTQRLDSSRTSLSGSYLSASLDKLAGQWLWTVSAYGQSPGLEINDAGRLSAADNWGVTGTLSYRQTKPGRLLRRWDVGAQGYQEWNYDRVRQVDYMSLYGNVTLTNFWSGGLSLGSNEPVYRDDLTRGGPVMGRPREWNVGLNLAGNPARRVRWKAYGSYLYDEAGGWSATGGAGLTARTGTRWELSTDPYYSQGIDARQFFTVLSDGPAATYGRRYVFAFLQYNELSTRLRASFALTPDLTLETYAEPFASSGHYYRFGDLQRARSFGLRMYGTEGTTLTRFDNDSIVVTDGARRFQLTPADFSVLSFRSNIVLRWEWRMGSTAYLVWQQNRGSENSSGTRVGPNALWNALSTNGENFLAVKVSYWLSAR